MNLGQHRLIWILVSILIGALIPDPLLAQQEDASELDAETGIEGRILDSETGEGLVDAPVIARGRGATHTAITIEGGRFLLPLPPGRYVLRSYYELYHGARLDRVRVRAGMRTAVTSGRQGGRSRMRIGRGGAVRGVPPAGSGRRHAGRRAAPQSSPARSESPL